MKKDVPYFRQTSVYITNFVLSLSSDIVPSDAKLIYGYLLRSTGDSDEIEVDFYKIEEALGLPQIRVKSMITVLVSIGLISKNNGQLFLMEPSE